MQRWQLMDDAQPNIAREQRRRHAQAAAFREYVLQYAPRVGVAGGMIGAGIMSIMLIFAAKSGIIALSTGEAAALVVSAFAVFGGLTGGMSYGSAASRYYWLLTTQGEEREYQPPVVEQKAQLRSVPFNGRPVPLEAPDKTASHRDKTATILGSQVLQMRDAVEEGDFAITRSRFQISGETYRLLQSIMVGQGYWRDMGNNRGYTWTHEGVAWLMQD